MQYAALTGISSYVLKDLQDNHVRTIEIHSPHNFITIHTIEAGDMVFITKTSHSDIKIGTIGLIARVNQRQIAMQRVMQRTEELYEEYETFTARLQLELGGLGRVRRLENVFIGKPCVVEVDTVTYLEAK
jgi:hypothetical protein